MSDHQRPERRHRSESECRPGSRRRPIRRHRHQAPRRPRSPNAVADPTIPRDDCRPRPDGLKAAIESRFCRAGRPDQHFGPEPTWCGSHSGVSERRIAVKRLGLLVLSVVVCGCTSTSRPVTHPTTPMTTARTSPWFRLQCRQRSCRPATGRAVNSLSCRMPGGRGDQDAAPRKGRPGERHGKSRPTVRSG